MNLWMLAIQETRFERIDKKYQFRFLIYNMTLIEKLVLLIIN